jgi:hypothetical protein
MGEKEQKKAISTLIELGIVEQRNVGCPQRRHFSINQAAIVRLLIGENSDDSDPEKSDEIPPVSNKVSNSSQRAELNKNPKTGGIDSAVLAESIPPKGRNWNRPLGGIAPGHIPYKELQGRTQNKQQHAADAANPQPPAAVFSEYSNPQKEQKLQIHECLKAVEIDEADKAEISRRYAESVVVNAIAWSAQQTEFTKGLAAALKFACKQGLKAEAPKVKLTPYEKLCKIFTRYQVYNDAECYLTPEYIAFERGMRNESVRFDKGFSWQKVKQLCESFGISFQQEALA